MSGQKIFISYRREESRWSARSLKDRLTAHFDPKQVFMDIDAIALGEDFIKTIEKTVGECDVLIAIIGARWLTSSDEQGGRRLDNPKDFVRMEVGTALRRDIRVIPVLVDGAMMPRSTDLPDDLKALVSRNALRISDDGFDDDCRRLVAAIEQVLEKRAAEQREEKARLETEQREKQRLEAERLEKERQEAEQQERERLKAVALETAELKREKPPLPSSGRTGGKSSPKRVIASLAIATVLVVGGLIFLIFRPPSSVKPPEPVIVTPIVSPTLQPFPSATLVIASGNRQLEFVKKNLSKLSSAGITATLREKPLSDDTRPQDTNEIRYFHREDLQEALRIAQAVRDAFGVALPDTNVKFWDVKPPQPRRYIEIWIARIP